MPQTESKAIELYYGCAMCGEVIRNESGYCPSCGDYSENVFTDDAGNEYDRKEVEKLIDSGEAVLV